MGLQAQGAGLVSKKWVREQIGVVDNSHMIEEILVEQVDDAVLGFFAATLQQAADPKSAMQVEQEAASFLAGGSPGGGGAQGPAQAGPHPLLSMPQGGPGQVISHAQAAAQGAAGATGVGPNPQPGGPSLPGLPPTQPGQPAQGPQLAQGQSQPPPQAQAAGGPGTVTTEQVAAAVSTLKGIHGQVFLVGQIADQGSTSGEIDLAITNPNDRAILEAGLSQWRGRLTFKVFVKGTPVEPHVEITPGKQATPGGQPDQLAAMLTG